MSRKIAGGGINLAEEHAICAALNDYTADGGNQMWRMRTQYVLCFWIPGASLLIRESAKFDRATQSETAIHFNAVTVRSSSIDLALVAFEIFCCD